MHAVPTATASPISECHSTRFTRHERGATELMTTCLHSIQPVRKLCSSYACGRRPNACHTPWALNSRSKLEEQPVEVGPARVLHDEHGFVSARCWRLEVQRHFPSQLHVDAILSGPKAL